MDVFQALADPVRRDILCRLVAGPARVVDLTAGRSISRPAVSRHLRLLSEAGLVRGDDHGRERHYRLDARPLDTVQDLITALSRAPRAPLTASALDALETEIHRVGRDRRQAPHTTSTTTQQEDIA